MTEPAEQESKPGIAIRIGLWFVQIILALLFGLAGWTKLSLPVEELGLRMPWATAVPDLLLRFIGVAELAGGVGVVLPALTRIRPALTPLAARGLVVLLVLAAGFHVTRAEYANAAGTVFLASLALFVAWGRERRAPIAPRR